MYYTAKSLDDLMRQVLIRLLNSKNRVKPVRGDNAEETGVLLKLSNPRTRISRTDTKGTAFSTLGELLWYLSGSNSLEFIRYYIPNYDENSDDGETIYGAYGPRLFQLSRGKTKIDQLQNIVRMLKDPAQQHSRRAVIQLFDGKDIHGKRHKDTHLALKEFSSIRSPRGRD